MGEEEGSVGDHKPKKPAAPSQAKLQALALKEQKAAGALALKEQKAAEKLALKAAKAVQKAVVRRLPPRCGRRRGRAEPARGGGRRGRGRVLGSAAAFHFGGGFSLYSFLYL